MAAPVGTRSLGRFYRVRLLEKPPASCRITNCVVRSKENIQGVLFVPQAFSFRFAFEARYFNCVDIEEKVLLSLVPSPLTTVMIATEMPAAIKAYSMAVAAVSSLKNALIKVRIAML